MSLPFSSPTLTSPLLNLGRLCGRFISSALNCKGDSSPCDHIIIRDKGKFFLSLISCLVCLGWKPSNAQQSCHSISFDSQTLSEAVPESPQYSGSRNRQSKSSKCSLFTGIFRCDCNHKNNENLLGSHMLSLKCHTSILSPGKWAGSDRCALQTVCLTPSPSPPHRLLCGCRKLLLPVVSA